MKSYRKLRLKKNKTKNKRRKNRLRGGGCARCPDCGAPRVMHTDTFDGETYEKCFCVSCGDYT